jgi:predicted MPP superfamily phosphohydrolase
VSAHLSPGWKKGVYFLFWAISAATIVTILATPYLRNQVLSPAWRIYPLAVMIGILIAKLLSVSFFIMDDLRRLIQWAASFFSSQTSTGGAEAEQGQGISRSAFLSWLGLGVGGTIFSTLLYGFKNQHNYKVHRVKLNFPNLPKAFRGMRIVQISDIHSGSFVNKEEVIMGVQAINDLKPDLILFTGDLVNDKADEMEPFKNIFSKLYAPMGVFSTLGNHDYGDYVSWSSAEAKQENLEKLMRIHKQMGWNLLMDESVILEKEGEKIGLIGVQNISGKSRFHSYGNLQKAYADTAALPFKMLLSHDPSHWDSEVLPKYPDIDITLSGHTHGMQFGVELPWFKWSPVQWMYSQWAGLYEKNNQRLYVNRGFGFIGYPGRVGILPEITLIELS